MKLIIASLVIFTTFFGCGSSSRKDFVPVAKQQEIPKQVESSDENTQEQEEVYQDEEEEEQEEKEPKVEVPAPIENRYSGPFKNIKSIIKHAQNGEMDNATYICYGDSTRSYSEYENQYIFEDIKYALNEYHINSINASETGIKAKDAANSSFPRRDWSDVADMIPADGSGTILDLSLGLNDYGDYSNSEIKSSLRTIISGIKSRKPETNFILTVPNRVYYNSDSMADTLTQIYKELSYEFDIPYIDVPKEAMPLSEYTLDWHRSGDQTHLKRAPQDRIARLILSKILP